MKKKFLLIVLSILAVLAGVIGLSACSKAKKMMYKVENIAYDGQYITWSKAELADYYNVQINGGEKERSNSTTYAYTSEETFEVTITVVADEKEKTSESVTFKPLATITGITVSENGALHWEAVSGANAYALTVNGAEITVSDTAYSELPAGSNRVKVRPIVSGDNTFYSKWSGEVSAYIYETPASLRYDGVNLTWLGNATDYAVTINGNTQTVRGNTFAFNSGNRDFTAVVTAIGNHTGTYDSKPVSEEFHYLDPVSAIFVEDGIVKWNAVNGAMGYKLKIDGVVQKAAIDGTAYDKLASGRSQDVAVMPYNDAGNYFSSWSAEKTVYILDTPVISWNNALELDGEANNNLTWNAVNAANGYTVRLIKNGGTPEISTYSDVQRAFAHAYAEVGVYTVEVKANASDASADYYDSKYSAPVTVERLAAPRAATENFIVSDRDSVANGFTVNFVQVNGASGYQLYKDGVLLSGKFTTASALSDRNVADVSNIAAQEYTYTVRSMGGVKTVSGRQYVTLPCLSASALSFNITVQATPQNPVMSGYALSWDAVAGNNGYIVALAGTTLTAQTEQCDLSTIQAGSYSITVAARGNGGSTLASNPSQPVAVQRLEAPTNIKISSDGSYTSENGEEITVHGTGVLQWDDVSNAKSYEAYLDLSKTPLNANAYGNMYQFIETNGTTLSMVAVANYYNDNGTLYYMTSQASPTQQFIRLAAPTFPEGALANSLELLWNAPGNINTAEYTPTYRVFYDNEGHFVQNGTKYNISDLVSRNGGYSFTVKAIGNDTKYLDSEESVVIYAYKIATPQLRIENGQYVWDSVVGASAYYLEIDGNKVSDSFSGSTARFSYTPRFTTEGDHIVKLKAVGDGRENLDSAYCTYIQKAKILQMPVIEYRYSGDSFVANGYITVTIQTHSEHCGGYQYEIAGQSETSAAHSYSKVIQSPGKYSVLVKALGGTFDSDNVYYIDSQYAGGSDVITILGAPSAFSMQSGGQIIWKGVADAKLGYCYQISYDGGEYGEVMSTMGPSVNLESDYKNYSTIRIRVWAKGSSDGTTVAGAIVEWTWDNPNPV